MASREDDYARELEVLAERLAQSREAIVRLLSSASGGEEFAGPPDLAAPVRLARSPRRAQPVPRPASDRDAVAPAEEGREAPAASELRPRTNVARRQAPLRPGSQAALARARRRLLAVVLVAVGAVVLLTALVTWV